MSCGATLLCLAALAVKRHLNMTGWTVLILGAYSVWFIFRCLLSAIRYGDPTRHIEPAESQPKTLYDYIEEDDDSR